MMKAAEASGKTVEERRAERRQRAVVGPLPDSFLRLAGPETGEAHTELTGEERDHELAVQLQRQLALEQRSQLAVQPPPLGQNVVGRLTITVVEARLNRNYGVTRMDPYARLRVGHNVYETPTCQNGAKEPKWNKTINCFLLAGTKAIDVEIYDERTFSQDQLVAHSAVSLTERVLTGGEMVDDWWPLSGQEGEEREGMLHLILSMQIIPPGSAIRLPGPGSGAAPSLGPPLQYQAERLSGVEQEDVVAAPPKLEPAELEEFSKMFPDIEKSVIEAVHTESRGNKEETVVALLQLGS